MIRDTSHQDRSIAVAPPSFARRLRAPVAIALVVLAAIYGLGQWVGSAKAVNAERLRFATVERGTLVRDAAVSGRVVAAVSPTLYAPAAATVNLRIAAGDSVSKGQVLALLDSPELDNERQREQATLQQVEAEVARQAIVSEQAKQTARRDADEAEVARTAASRDLQRAERGFELGAIAEIDLLKARDALKTAEIRAGHAAAASGLAVRSADLELNTKRQQLERQRLLVSDLDRRIDELQVRAPADGIIGTLAVADRAVVAQNTALMTVVDLSRLEIELAVPEAYANDLGIGMAAELHIDMLTTTGKVSAISPEVVAGQVLARVRFDGEQPQGLRQSQRVSARVLFEEKTDVLMLARGPFVEAGSGRSAYVVEDGIAVRRPIRLGALSVTAVEVTEGLAAGDRVVIAGLDSFGDAERVAIND